MSAHWYNLYNPVISVELTELYDGGVGNNDAVKEIQLHVTVQQHRVPAWNESLFTTKPSQWWREVKMIAGMTPATGGEDIRSHLHLDGIAAHSNQDIANMINSASSSTDAGLYAAFVSPPTCRRL